MTDKPRRRNRRTDFLAVITGPGKFEIASFADFARYEKRRYGEGEQVMIQIRLSRNPYFHRLVLGLVRKLAENRDEFDGDVDRALNTLKIQLGRATAFGMSDGSTGWIPESIAFDMMDEGEFRELFSDLCDLIAREYWPDMTPEAVDRMARMLADRWRE